MAARPNPADPHSVYHAYDYYDLKAKSSNKNNLMIDCQTSGVCKVKPRVKIVDNWGWCTEGIDGSPCPTGVCISADKKVSTKECVSDNGCAGIISGNTVYKYCADGWYETPGEIIVYEPGTK
jgi:hypothetical protein